MLAVSNVEVWAEALASRDDDVVLATVPSSGHWHANASVSISSVCRPTLTSSSPVCTFLTRFVPACRVWSS